jgi:hypothetical protein
VDENAQVIGTDWRPITGLFACGEMIGGLFYDNYPAGTGLPLPHVRAPAREMASEIKDRGRRTRSNGGRSDYAGSTPVEHPRAA